MNIVALAIRRPVTVAMFTLAMLVFGMVLLERLGFNLLPELAYPTLTVRTDFPGSAPEEVENLISRPLEETLGTVKGLRQVRSVSKAGSSDVYLEFYWGSNMDLASLDVREKMDQVQLPLEVKAPTLLRFNPNNDPIIRLSLSNKLEPGDDPVLAMTELRRYADNQLTRRLQTIDGVAAARASGGYEDEIQILLNQAKLAQLNLSVDEVAQRLKAQNVNSSGGQIRDGQRQLLVRTFNEFKSIEDIEESIVVARDQRVIRLKEIAEIKFTHKDPTAITRNNGEQAVEISIYKEGDANIIQVAEAVNARLNGIKRSLPDGMSLLTLTDASIFIDESISELIFSAIIGGILAMIVIYLFLGDIRPTLIISATIPLSVIITFNFMYMSDIDINIMSLGGLALAIGMLVDNAIVVLENIARKKEEGLDLNTAAEQGANEVSGAITASTLTTIAVFLPIIFVEGVAGQLFRDQALTITYSLLVSLVVALTLIPMMASRKVGSLNNDENLLDRPAQSKWKKIGRSPVEIAFVALPWLIMSALKLLLWSLSFVGMKIFSPLRKLFDRSYAWLETAYQKLLSTALSHSWLTVLFAFGTLLFALALARQIPQIVLPEIAQGQLIVKVQYAPGSAIELTDQRMTNLSQKLLAFDQVNEVFATAGTGNKLTANPEQEGENQAELTLLLTPGLSRDDEDKLLVEIRELLAIERDTLGVETERPQLFSFSTPLEINIFGFEINDLRKVGDLVVERLQRSEKFADLSSNTKRGYPEAQVIFDQAKLAQLNIPMQSASAAVVDAIKGNTATRYRLRDQQIDILVRLENSARDELNDLSQLIINPTSSRPIPLTSVATIAQIYGPSEIMRIDQQRVVVVAGQIQVTGITEAVAEAQVLLQDLEIPYGTSVQFGGQSEEMQRSFNSLFLALSLAVFLVYLVMASQFESLLHPFIILFSVPLSLIGAIFGLAVSGTSISVMVFLGLIMLAGIVVNNAIVLVDRINQLRDLGNERTQAILQAAQSRLRPILMTTLTTTLGMLPLALGFGEGAELRAPMAVTVIGGLLSATLLTLVVIPVMYQLFDRKKFVATPEPTSEEFS
ncbi:efflux RND transporter permease subunit [Aurantivibrio infirmus]